MNWLKHTLALPGIMVVVIVFAAAIFPTRASALAATLTRDIDNPARDTFQAFFESKCANGAGGYACTGLTLPTTNGAGAPISMAVIESVSAQCTGGAYSLLTRRSLPSWPPPRLSQPPRAHPDTSCNRRSRIRSLNRRGGMRCPGLRWFKSQAIAVAS